MGKNNKKKKRQGQNEATETNDSGSFSPAVVEEAKADGITPAEELAREKARLKSVGEN